MARFSPYEWNNPHPCSPEAHIVENQFSVSNSFWFITGTFLRQGSGLNPKVVFCFLFGEFIFSEITLISKVFVFFACAWLLNVVLHEIRIFLFLKDFHKIGFYLIFCSSGMPSV